MCDGGVTEVTIALYAWNATRKRLSSSLLKLVQQEIQNHTQECVY